MTQASAATRQPATLVDVFARTAAAHPHAPAVSDNERRLDYAELDRRSDALARLLHDRGIGCESTVAIHRRRDVDVVVAILGVLKAGAAYLPVDTRYPRQRRDFMIRDGSVAAVLTEPGWGARLAGLGTEVLEWRSEPAEGGEPLDCPAVPANAACVLYTSGSTGVPKGIVLEHRQLAAFALDPAMPPLRPGDRMGQIASISFDPVNLEVWCSLSGGAEIVMLPTFTELVAADLKRELRRRNITVMIGPAIGINHAVRADRHAFAALRVLYSGGDVLLPSTCQDLLAGAFTGRLFNLYGPAETTTACTAYEITAIPLDADAVPIGHAYAGATLYVLDADLRPVSRGQVGELYVGGSLVGRGYHACPGLTAQRFLPDPFSRDGGRMYATGDLVRANGTGDLEYLGRGDSQVKIRGYRVEPCEVERRLCRHQDIRQAAVLAVGDVPDRTLVAVVVPEAETLTPREVRGYLSESLPDFMVPAELVVLDELPTDAHGKRDWTALAATVAERIRRRARHVRPHDEMERYLVALWESLLRTERVSVLDDFFSLGGHSLLVAEAHKAIHRDWDVALPFAMLFENSVLRDLARVLTNHRGAVVLS